MTDSRFDAALQPERPTQDETSVKPRTPEPPINPKATVGDNQPVDYAKRVHDAMEEAYAALIDDARRLLEQARAMPKAVEDEPTVGMIGKLIKDIRDMERKLEAYRQTEKEQYLRGGQGVDRFFGSWQRKLARDKKTDAAGAADILLARIDAYNQEKLAREKAAREAAERAAREEFEAAARVRAEHERAQREAEERAERARKQANIDAHNKEAEERQRQADIARANEQAARDRLTDARIGAAAKPSDMVRTRHDQGVMSTMRQVPYVEIEDVTKLDKALLWPFLKEEHILQALKAYAKTRNHKVQMDGAIIEMRNDTSIR